jgi:hypothetical protein
MARGGYPGPSHTSFRLVVARSAGLSPKGRVALPVTWLSLGAAALRCSLTVEEAFAHVSAPVLLWWSPNRGSCTAERQVQALIVNDAAS